MAARLYIVPVIGTGTKADPRRPKYFADGGIPAGTWSAVDYGFEPWMFVGADLSPADDATIVGKPDAFALPFDMTPTLTGAQVTNVQSKLESANIPAGWVNTSLTWNQVAKTVLDVFQFVQRFGGIYAQQNSTTPPSLFSGGVTLNSTFSSLPSPVRSALVAAADSLNIDHSTLTGSTTIRAILKTVADALSSRPVIIGPITL